MNLSLRKIDFTSFKTILIAALVIRIIAAIFSKGYGMHDDHFVIIETASSWSDGIDNSGWLSWSEQSIGKPQGHSFTYVGINYLLFKALKMIGIHDPQLLMLFNRFFHAFLSLLVVYFGIKITTKISSKKNAIIVGWLLAFLWVMPFLSVRNLVEMTSMPFLIWGSWMLLKEEKNKNFLIAGLLIGVAISFRYQIAIFAIAIAAYYFFNWRFKSCFYFCIGVILMFSATQGIVDFIVWGYPFAEFIGYATYNMNEGTQYLPNQNYLMYFLVLMGVMLFPLGILMMIGFFKTWKTQTLLFLPTLAFILFHTFYPNRQERFVLTIVPYFIILGVVGFDKIRQKIFWDKTWKTSMLIFWILNIPIMLFLTLTYTKMSRVEAMYALYGNKMKGEKILLEGSRETKPSMMPQFYANSWDCKFTERLDTTQLLDVVEGSKYDYIFFFGEEKLKERIDSYKRINPQIHLIKKCFPSTLDEILRKMNHHNTNQYIEVWKTK
ncbi:MAG: glycosyltransferase family 39 protein [Flavobacteriia bacterium]|nr:glycosyltransferase family 39 protein [Flavobacteriia bacterium]